MGAASDLSFDSICRTCMHVVAEEETFAATTAEIKCHSIFDTVAECGTMRVVELLSTTTPQLQVNFSDELPQKICRECLKLLLSVYRFQQMCRQSEQQMREILDKRYLDVKLMIPVLLTESTEGPKQISMVDAKEGEIVTEAVEVPLANDPLQNDQFLKIEEFIDRDECICEDKTNEASAVGTNLVDSSLINKVGAQTTVNESGTTCDEVPSYCTSDMPNFRAGKESNFKNFSTHTHSCSKCNKSFSQRRLLNRHLKRHEKWEESKNLPVKPLNTDQRIQIKCDICGRRFNKPESLHEHKQKHTDQPQGEAKKIYACDLCDKTYSSKRMLAYHKKRSHSEGPSFAAPARHVCEFCNKGFQFRASLVDHLRTHTGEKPFLCSLCGKSFRCSSNMKQHLIRHSGVKRFECPECPKKFACNSDLSKHKVIHRLIKPHNCDICSASFAKSYDLKAHKMYHNGDKPYKCKYCDMRFVLMDKQRRHMRTHTGEKPYKCKYCERAFAQSNDLIKHLRNHLGENVYKCELCPSAFRLAAELRVHFALHKNDDEETRARNMLALKEDASLGLHLRPNGFMSTTNSSRS